MVDLEYVTEPRVHDAEFLAQAVVKSKELNETERQFLHSNRPAQTNYSRAPLEAVRDGTMKEIPVHVGNRLEVSNVSEAGSCY